MTRAGSFLDRFRRLVAPPGRPSEAVGVPASGDDLEAELAPLLADVDDIHAQAQQIDADAQAEAERRSLLAFGNGDSRVACEHRESETVGRRDRDTRTLRRPVTRRPGHADVPHRAA